MVKFNIYIDLNKLVSFIIYYLLINNYINNVIINIILFIKNYYQYYFSKKSFYLWISSKVSNSYDLLCLFSI